MLLHKRTFAVIGDLGDDLEFPLKSAGQTLFCSFAAVTWEKPPLGS